MYRSVGYYQYVQVIQFVSSLVSRFSSPPFFPNWRKNTVPSTNQVVVAPTAPNKTIDTVLDRIMSRLRLSLVSFVLLFFSVSSSVVQPVREKVNFDFGWRHKLGIDSNDAVCPGFEEGTNYGTGGSVVPNIKSADMCCRFCSLEPNCGCWDYNLKSNDCWVKTDCRTNSSTTEHRVSGKKRNDWIPTLAQTSFDDSAWDLVNTPHDMLIVQNFDKGASKDQGFLPRNVGWYRKSFYIPDEWGEQSVFWWRCEGSFHETFVYFNNQFIGVHKAGYTSFSVRLDNTSNVRYGSSGQPNVLALYVNASTGTGWWYEGGGLMRHNYIIRTNPVHIVENSAWVHSVPELSTGKSTFHVAAEICAGGNRQDEEYWNFVAEIIDDRGLQVGSGHQLVSSSALDVQLAITVEHVKLWSVQSPSLYVVKMTIFSSQQNNQVLDSVNVTTGIRSVEFNSNVGLLINEKEVKLRGFCDHSSFGVVGGAVPDRINLYRAQMLRSVGGNAWRMAHNPPIPARLEFMDALGMLAIDENRDYGGRVGQGGVTPETVSNELNDMAELVRRDRSHPSVIVWSFCNEVGCKNDSSARPWRELTKLLDPTRAVTQNHLGSNLSTMFLDVQGFSHKHTGVFDRFHKTYPLKPMLATECCSCMSQRGVDEDFCPSPEDGGCGGVPGAVFYNNNIGQCTSKQVIMSDAPNYIAGTFVWSGFDYLGESRGWPQNIKCRGTIADVAGFRKETSFWLRSWWLSNISRTDAGRPLDIDADEAPWTVFIVDSWVPPPKQKPTRNITVYTNAPIVHLLVNNKIVGKQTVPFFGVASFEVDFEPGNLTAIAFDSNGRYAAQWSKFTPGTPAKLVLNVDVPSNATRTGSKLVLDGEDVAMIRADIVDKNGVVVNGANNNITFTIVSGAGKIWGTHNGDPANLSPNHASWTLAYHGLARAVVRTTKDSSSPGWHRNRLLEMIPKSERTVNVLSSETHAYNEAIIIRAHADGIDEAVELSIETSSDPNDLPYPVARRGAF